MVLTYGYWDARTTHRLLEDVATAPLRNSGLLAAGRSEEEEAFAQRCWAAEAAILEDIQVSRRDVERLRRLPQLLPDGGYNPAWLAARRWRLTASKFPNVRRRARRRELAQRMLQSWWHRGAAGWKEQRARAFEDAALGSYAARLAAPRAPPRREEPPGGLRVATVGLLVAPSMPWLAASPDGIVLGDPDGGADLGTTGAGSVVRLLEMKSYTVELCTRSPVWVQVQGSMAIASDALGAPVACCDVVTPTEVFRVRFDERWWRRYLGKLKEFYFEFFLPLAAEHVAQLSLRGSAGAAGGGGRP